MFKIYPARQRIPQYYNIDDIYNTSRYTIDLFIKVDYKLIDSIYVGQFFLIYDFEELHHEKCEWIPISISHINRIDGMIGFTIKNNGETTNNLCKKRRHGNKIGLIGPFGNGFYLNKVNNWGMTYYVCGGVGIAPLIPIINKQITIFHGLQNIEHIFLLDHIKSLTNNYYVFFDDITIDKVLCKLEEHIVLNRCQYVLTCGPEPMMKKVLDLCNKYNIGMQACTERYIKCGRGICGSCCINDQRVCTDGPVFTREQLNNMPDFGKCFMNQSGERIYYEKKC